MYHCSELWNMYDCKVTSTFLSSTFVDLYLIACFGVEIQSPESYSQLLSSTAGVSSQYLSLGRSSYVSICLPSKHDPNCLCPRHTYFFHMSFQYICLLSSVQNPFLFLGQMKFQAIFNPWNWAFQKQTYVAWQNWVSEWIVQSLLFTLHFLDFSMRCLFVV